MSAGEPIQPGSSGKVRIDNLTSLFLWAIGLILFLRFFDAFRLIVLGFLAASIAAAAMRPLKRFFPGPRWWSALLAAALPAMLFVVLVLLISWALSGPIHKEIANWPEIREQIDKQLMHVSKRLGLEDQLTLKELAGQVPRVLGASVVATTASIMTNTLLAVVFIFFGSLYLISEKEERLVWPIRLLLPASRREQLDQVIHELEPKLRWWLIGSFIAMVTTALATWIGYSLVGLEFAGPLALLAGVAEIVPTFGPVSAFLLALLFAAAKGGGTIAGIIGVYIVIQGLESYVLQPLVMKRAVNIPPVVTLFTIILWSQVFGAVGLILALPIDLVIWTLLDHFVLRPRAAAQAGNTSVPYRPISG